jgi:hypothetical protein
VVNAIISMWIGPMNASGRNISHNSERRAYFLRSARHRTYPLFGQLTMDEVSSSVIVPLA